jgi:Putative peptidoglycan binding domain/KAP family P-loop domain
VAEEETEQAQEAERAAPDDDVRTLQLSLQMLGFNPGATDGIAGPGTKEAVAAFQRAQGLPMDGIPGPQTRALLDRLVSEREQRPEEPQPADPFSQFGSFVQEVRPRFGYVSDPSDASAAGRLLDLLVQHADRVPPEEADGVLVFLSASLLQHPLDANPELQRTLTRAQAGETRLIPVVLSAVIWTGTPFVEFQAVAGGRPLSELNDLSPVADEIARILRAPIARLAARRSYLPGFAADATEGEDLLGRRERVDFLASVLAAHQLETPLAVGLFGDWGSGKSFFMRRLQEQVVALTKASAAARVRGEESYYCSDVRQVSFNAWLYSDSDIWSSFAAHVFQGMSGLVGDLSEAAALDARMDALSNEIAERDRRKRALAAGLAGEAGTVARMIDDARDIVRGVRRPARTWRRRDLLFVVLPVAAAVVFAALTLIRPSWASFAATIVLALGAVVAFLAKVVRHVDESTQLQAEIDHLEREREDLRKRRDALVPPTGGAQDGIDPALLLPGFAEEQTLRWLGRERLGVVTEIRLAFERVSKLIEASRRPRPVGSATDGKPSIDRIIVYIDDLDRCRHDVVVRVLETLQLLVGLPHFVVVVGVDSRWLFRSLEVHFKELLTSDGAAADAEWAATPQNYLEKIFQYSVVLRPIGEAGFGNLIEKVLGGAGAPADETAGEQQTTEGSPPPVETGGVVPTARPTPAAAVTDVDLTPDDLVITPEELAFMKRLAPIIETPRAAKRLANLYRLLRVSVGADELTQNEAYEPVLLLLAIGIGYPGLATDVFDAIARFPGTPWPVFLDQLRPRPVPAAPPAPARVGNLVDDDLAPVEAAVWQKFASVVARIAPDDVADRNLASFAPWIEVVAEFSFHPWQERLPAETHG